MNPCTIHYLQGLQNCYTLEEVDPVIPISAVTDKSSRTTTPDLNDALWDIVSRSATKLDDIQQQDLYKLLQQYHDVFATDILGPLPVTLNGNSYLLVATDYFTRWVEAYPIPTQEAVTVANKLTKELFFHFSVPEQLHSDQDCTF